MQWFMSERVISPIYWEKRVGMSFEKTMTFRRTSCYLLFLPVGTPQDLNKNCGWGEVGAHSYEKWGKH